MTLYRAIAYQLQPLDTPPAAVQPETCVFFESHSAETAPATLLRLLALAWGCTAPEVDFYNLHSEAELLRDGADEAPGEAALWLSGNYHGPLFHNPQRTLAVVRPTTLARLHSAWQATAPLRALQHQAAEAADQAMQAQQRTRNLFMADLAQQLRSEIRAGA